MLFSIVYGCSVLGFTISFVLGVEDDTKGEDDTKKEGDSKKEGDTKRGRHQKRELKEKPKLDIFPPTRIIFTMVFYFT